MKVLKLSLILFLSLSSFTYCLGPLIKPISLYYFIAKLFEPEVNENEAQNRENEAQNQAQNQENGSQNQAQNQENGSQNQAQNQENGSQNQENESQNQESIFGQIDPSFGDGGYKIFDIPSVSPDFAESLVLKGDKILQGGYCNNPPGSIFCLVQYDVSGNVDSSFGSGGYVTFDINWLNI
jgi:preprotein translocase subunit SecF